MALLKVWSILISKVTLLHLATFFSPSLLRWMGWVSVLLSTGTFVLAASVAEKKCEQQCQRSHDGEWVEITHIPKGVGSGWVQKAFPTYSHLSYVPLDSSLDNVMNVCSKNRVLDSSGTRVVTGHSVKEMWERESTSTTCTAEKPSEDRGHTRCASELPCSLLGKVEHTQSCTLTSEDPWGIYLEFL